MVGFIFVVAIEMPFSSAVRTLLAHVTPKVKGKPSPQQSNKISPSENGTIQLEKVDHLKSAKV